MNRVLPAAVLLLVIPACGADANISITAAGSIRLLPLVKRAAVEYRAEHPNVTISVSGGGSRFGITQVAQKAVDLGDSDIPAPDDPSLVDHIVARNEHIFTNGQPSAQVAGFIEFIKTDTTLLRQLHFIPVK